MKILFVCLGLSGFTQEDVTVKGCKFLPLLGTHGHRAVRVLQRATPTMTRDIRL